jgi:hypothetical protein
MGNRRSYYDDSVEPRVIHHFIARGITITEQGAGDRFSHFSARVGDRDKLDIFGMPKSLSIGLGNRSRTNHPEPDL